MLILLPEASLIIVIEKKKQNVQDIFKTLLSATLALITLEELRIPFITSILISKILMYKTYMEFE